MTHTVSSSDSSNSTSDRLASMAHETSDRVAPKSNRAEREVRGAAVRAADGAKLVQARAAEAAEESVRTLRSCIQSNPLTTAAIAFAAGALLSALLRR